MKTIKQIAILIICEVLITPIVIFFILGDIKDYVCRKIKKNSVY